MIHLIKIEWSLSKFSILKAIQVLVLKLMQTGHSSINLIGARHGGYSLTISGKFGVWFPD